MPQLTDPDYKTRPRVREADLKRHLINEAKVDNGVLEDDSKTDPRFAVTAEELKKKGVEDFQLNYAIDAVVRAGRKPAQMAANAGRSGGKR